MQEQENIKGNIPENREIEQNHSISKSLNSKAKEKGSYAAKRSDPVMRQQQQAATTATARRFKRSNTEIEEKEHVSDTRSSQKRKKDLE